MNSETALYINPRGDPQPGSESVRQHTGYTGTCRASIPQQAGHFGNGYFAAFFAASNPFPYPAAVANTCPPAIPDPNAAPLLEGGRASRTRQPAG